jgi:YesN/AraC family two-component response regulator
MSTFVSEPAILIIDDNFAIREALTDIISLLLKMTIYTAANGYEGLQIFQQRSIALVILDLNMPKMNGQQTYERLQQIAPQVKVIISSSLSLVEARLFLGEQELPTFLQKPYDVDTLLNVLQAELAKA